MKEKRTAQPPIPRKMVTPVLNVIDRMESKQIALAKQAFTATDLLTLFIKPEHHDTLTKAYELCEPSGHTQDLFSVWMAKAEYGGALVHLRFHWHGSDVPSGFYVPFLCGAQMDHSAAIRPEAPEDLQDRLRQTVHDMIDIHWNFVLVRNVFERLNRASVCPSLEGMRYHWPCIVPILRDARYPDLADAISDVNSRAGDRVMLTPYLRKHVAQTNRTVANHQLVSDLPDPPAPPIAYELRHNFR